MTSRPTRGGGRGGGGKPVRIDPEVLRAYAENLEALHSVITSISEYMHTTACDKSGFTGLFMVLQPLVDLVGSLYDETLKFGHERLASMAAGITEAAKRYQEHEDSVVKRLEALLRELDKQISASPEDGPSRRSHEPVY
ncbi:hypothetical protein [Amycolatopsis sp. NPDC059021]|uniref:hypothetical protein n=1 Tax=Amycolatopsis sp. NPDC059021 TaxID=3346704 RepID=UPI00366EE984